MSDKLTRRGALQLTQTINRIATVIQANPGLLGLPPKIALDFAKRCDMVSDAVERTAAANFPGATPVLPIERVAAEGCDEEKEEGKKKAGEVPDALKEHQFESDDKKDEKKSEKKSESKKKASASNGGWDPSQIESSGEALDWQSDEPYMAEFQGEEFSQLTDKVEGGGQFTVDKFARELAAWNKEGGVEARGFVDQLSALGNRAKELKAQVTAAIEPLLPALEGDVKKPHEVLLKSYAAAFGLIADACDAARDDLIERQASSDVGGVLGYFESFIDTVESVLGDMEEALRVPFQGFEMEKRGLLKTAGRKDAGLASLLTTFQEMLRKGWRRMDAIAKNGEGLVTKAQTTLEGALKGWDKMQTEVTEVTKGASTKKASFAGFDLTA